MKTKLLLFVLLISSPMINAQIVNLYAPQAPTTQKVLVLRTERDSTRTNDLRRYFEEIDTVVQAPRTEQFEWFEGGNIDYISSGLLQTNARLLKVNLGIPGKFYVPFYIMAGADKQTSTDSSEDPNESTNVNLLSTNGGYLNFGLHGNTNLYTLKSDSTGKTRFSAVYLLGAKSIIGKDAITEERISMLSMVTNLGLMFQTNAWNPDNPGTIGIAWIQAVITNTFNNDEKIKQIYGNDIKKNFYGFNIEGGIQVDDHVNLRFGYYKYLNNQDINKDFKDGIFKLSVDFNLTN